MHQVYYRAAGGVVIHASEVLLLDRPSRDEVRLPKGHVEDGESPDETALREVSEEAGYIHLDILADLGEQRVQFVNPLNQRRIIRDERYFLMRLRDEGQIERDAQEHQFTPLWVPIGEAPARLTFEAEQEFVRRALRWLEDNGHLDDLGYADFRSK